MLGRKADTAGCVWTVYEKDGIVKRVSPRDGISPFPRTLYWRRGSFFPNGTPRWVRFIADTLNAKVAP